MPKKDGDSDFWAILLLLGGIVLLGALIASGSNPHSSKKPRRVECPRCHSVLYSNNPANSQFHCPNCGNYFVG